MMKKYPMLSVLNPIWTKLIAALVLLVVFACNKSFEDKMNAIDNEGREIMLTLTNPVDESAFYTQEIEVSGRVNDLGGIQYLEILLNHQAIRFQAVSGKWSQKIKLQIGENKISAKLVNSKGDVYKTPSVYVYRLWEKTGDLPNPVAYPAVYRVNDWVYILGGWTFQWDFLPAMDNLWRYQVNTKQIQTLTPSLVNPCYGANIGVYDQQLYIISGLKKKEGGDFAKNDKIDSIDILSGLLNLSWNQIENPQFVRAGAAYGQIDNALYIAGGIDPDGNTTDSIIKYDLAAKQWQALGVLGKKIRFPASIVHDRKLFIFGGIDEAGNFLKTIYVYDPEINGVFCFSDRLKYSRAGLGATKIGSKVYLLGGETLNSNGNKEYLDVVEVFNLETQTVLELRKMPAKLGYMGLTNDGNKILLFGGKDSGDFPSKSWIYEYYPQYDNLNP